MHGLHPSSRPSTGLLDIRYALARTAIRVPPASVVIAPSRRDFMAMSLRVCNAKGGL